MKLVYKSNYDDDLCVYSKKCLSPSLTQWEKLNNENLESEMLKCMIDIRNKKNKIVPWINPDPKTMSENEETTKTQKIPENTPENNYFGIYISIVTISSFIAIFSFFLVRKTKKNVEMNIQATAHSIDKNLGNLEMQKKESTKEKIVEVKEKNKKNDGKENLKSNIVIDKENILGYGANGTIVYNGLFQNREMAIKRIVAHNAELAKQEMDILMKLDHPNIIKFYYYEEQKYFF